MKSFNKMLDHYGMDHTMFTLGEPMAQGDEQDTSLPQATLGELMRVGNSPLVFTVPPSDPDESPEHFALRPADGTIYDPDTGEVFSESDDYTPPFAASGGSPTFDEFDDADSGSDTSPLVGPDDHAVVEVVSQGDYLCLLCAGQINCANFLKGGPDCKTFFPYDLMYRSQADDDGGSEHDDNDDDDSGPSFEELLPGEFA